jgi:predicted 3-demethylubiquinone-9 3-methyltransferase (glyoxalase superfamily)
MAKGKLSTFLWFDKEAEEAADFYCSVFKNARKGEVSRYPEAMGAGVMTVEFELDGYFITAMNAGPRFRFNESFSVLVDCEDQAEVDRYWTALTADGGEESMCGWLKDKYGMSWQIIPRRLMELMGDKDREAAGRVSQAMLQMRKIVVADLEKAYAG